MKLIVGVTGASGIKLAMRLVEELRKRNIEVYTIVTKYAEKVAEYEGKEILLKIKEGSKEVYKEDEMNAPISSSSFSTNGMVIIPCSMNTIAKLANGIADNLLLRVADVQIKVKNKLVLVPRETPLSQIHLGNMLKLSRIQSIFILVPVLTYYHKPKNLEQMENFVIGKILDILDIKNDLYKRWEDISQD